MTAFIIAAGEPIAPASPQPFAPSGLCVHGVTVVPTSNDGRSMLRLRDERRGDGRDPYRVGIVADHHGDDKRG